MDRNRKPPTCRRLEILMNGAVEGSLQPGESARLGAHLERCQACRAELEDLRLVRGVLGARPRADLPPGFEGRLASRLDVPWTWVSAADWRRWTYRLVPVAAALVLLAGVFRGTSVETDGYPQLPQVLRTWALGDQAAGEPPSAILLEEGASTDSLLEAILTGQSASVAGQQGEKQ
jgi:anti-sigma factor RsiW